MESIMATLTISLSDEEMRRLEVLGKHEGLTVEQMVRLGINDLINQPDAVFHTAARRVIEKNTELYRRLS
jgi:predicted DNA-binding protein